MDAHSSNQSDKNAVVVDAYADLIAFLSSDPLWSIMSPVIMV